MKIENCTVTNNSGSRMWIQADGRTVYIVEPQPLPAWEPPRLSKFDSFMFRMFDRLEKNETIRSESAGADLARLMAKTVWCLLLFAMVVDETLNDKSQSFNWATYSQITLWILLQNLGVLAAVLMTLGIFHLIKPLRFSWLMLFDSKSSGDNIGIAPVRIPWVGLLFAVLLFINLPTLALAEEKMFRLGVTEWPQAVKWSIIFGLVHCLVGVPISAGLALSVGGLWFHYQCFEGGITQSTIHHTAYNAIVMAILIISAASASIATLVKDKPQESGSKNQSR